MDDDSKAWIRKYFKAASVINISLLVIKGINDNILISNPIHAAIQGLEEMVIFIS